MENNNFITQDTKNLIITAQENNQVSKPLAKQFTIMLNAIASADSATWKFSKALATIVNDELYKQNGIESANQFAKTYHISQPLLSRAKYAVENLKVLANYGYDENNISVSKSYILSRLAENQETFLNYCVKTGFNIAMHGEKALTEKIKEFIEKVVKPATDESTQETESNQETETDETETEESYNDDRIKAVIEDDMLYITIGKKLYAIPQDELKEYEVKE